MVKKIIVDVSGIYDQNVNKGVYINEITFYDETNEIIPYEIGEVVSRADSYSKPAYWDYSDTLDKNNLNDGNTTFSNANVTYLGMRVDSDFTRFVLSPQKDISRLTVFLGGDTYKRTPKKIEFYACQNYTNKNLKDRDNSGLSLIASVSTTAPLATATAFERIAEYANDPVTKYLFSKSNIAYTIENGTLKSLGTITTANASTLFESGVEAITKEHCVLVGQQLGKAKIMRMSV